MCKSPANLLLNPGFWGMSFHTRGKGVDNSALQCAELSWHIMAMSVWKMIKPSEIGISNPVPQKTEIVNHTLLLLYRVELRLMSDHGIQKDVSLCYHSIP